MGRPRNPKTKINSTNKRYIYIYIFIDFRSRWPLSVFGPHKLTFVLTRFKLPELPVDFGGNALTAPVLDFIRFAPQIFRAREKKRASIFFQFLFLAHSNSRFLFSSLGRRICTKCMGLSAPLDLELAPHSSVPGRQLRRPWVYPLRCIGLLMVMLS
jgi:hypothetical protein